MRFCREDVPNVFIGRRRPRTERRDRSPYEEKRGGDMARRDAKRSTTPRAELPAHPL